MVEQPRRGEVYWALMRPLEGSGTKVRPALVVQNDVGNRFSPNTIVVPISSRVPVKDYPFHVPLPKGLLPKPSVAKCERVQAVSKNRLKPSPLATCDADVMAEVDAALKAALGLD